MLIQRITTLEEIRGACDKKQSLFTPIGRMKKPKAAAFVINMSGSVILCMIKEGLYIYSPAFSALLKAAAEQGMKIDRSAYLLDTYQSTVTVTLRGKTELEKHWEEKCKNAD